MQVTPLSEAGLSARALSAIEPLAVTTVADLVAVDPVRLNHLSGVSAATRGEVKARARQWRTRFGSAVTGRGPAPGDAAETGATALPDPVTAARLLVEHSGSARAESRRALARLLLGLAPGIDAFASQAEIAEVTGVTRGRVPQQLGALHDAWGGDEGCRELLDTLAETAWQSLADSGGVAAVGELAQSMLAVMPPAVGGDNGPSVDRVAAGLLRIALDRVQALLRAEDDAREFFSRRRDGRIVLLAADQALLDPAEALGRAADELVAQAAAAGEYTVPASRAAGTAARRVEPRRARPGITTVGARHGPAAATGRRAGAGRSPRRLGDLYARAMPATAALTIALAGVGTQPVGVQEVHARVRAKFPALSPLPDRPRLDQLIDDTGLGLVYDEAERAYRSRTRASDTLGLDSRPATVHWPGQPSVACRRPVRSPPRRERGDTIVPRHRRGRDSAPTAPWTRSPAGSASRSWT